MNRRRFLKYAGCAAAVVGTSALGLDFLMKPFPPNSSQPSTVPTSTSNQTVLVTSPTTSLRTTDLELMLFADRHGDGVQQSDEPTIKDIQVEVTGIDTYYDANVVADSDGKYWARNIPVGRQYRVIAKSDKYRYIALSNSEFKSINDYSYAVSSDEPNLRLGLMEGFLTQPVTSKTNYAIASYYDRDPNPTTYLWWNREHGLSCELNPGSYCNYNHPGIDYAMKIGETLVAQAPGIVNVIGRDPGGPKMFILHPNGLFTGHGHFSKPLVSEGSTVQRGQPVALSGTEGPRGTIPHDHVSLIYGQSYAIDPYAPEFKITDQYSGYYDMSGVLKDGNFRWIPLPLNDQNPNLLNYWTKQNDPQYAVT